MSPLENVLRKEIGLDAASIGMSLIERAARLRMKGLGLKKIEDYEKVLATSRTEVEQFVESVVVTETWFFRDVDSFAAFVRLVTEEWLPVHPIGQFRVLSIPCSSGEEPYSLSMALLDARVKPERFVIDGVDVSIRALGQAKRAVFGKNSFRGKELGFRDRHFQHTREGYSLMTNIRECVQFHRDNVLSPGFLSGRAQYDFIFCRNLLIYFDRETQSKVLETLAGMLSPEGILFVGPAEQPLLLDRGYSPVNLPMSFAFRRNGASAAHLDRFKRVPRAPKFVQMLASLPQPPLQKPVVARARATMPVAQRSTNGPPADLANARKLADAGQLKEAATVCERYLREQEPSAEAFYLLGLVRDAGGDLGAEDFYRKALYLEPEHYETLWHMALLLEKKGDVAGARAHKQRAERAQKKAVVKK